jgi:DNA helicase-2/ATP-dependent DNA helicase PcrA
MEYIGTVLPSLGEVGVRQSTFREFALNILDLSNIMSFKDYMERILKGDKEFIEEVIYKTSTDYLEELNSFIEELDKDYFKLNDVKFYDKTVVSSEELRKLFTHHYKDMPLFRRSKKVKRIVYLKLRDRRDEEVRRIQKDYSEKLAKMSKTELEIHENSLNMLRKHQIREVIKEIMRAKKEMAWIHNPDCVNIYNEFNEYKQLTQDDLAPILYLRAKLEGLRLKEETKHVVIDEAQDYSPIQFLVIKELTKCSSMTVVGDSNQRLLPLKGETPMLRLKDIVSDLNVEHFNLYKSYRSTKEIMEYANKYLGDSRIVPLVRSGEPVIEEKTGSEEELVEKIDELLGRLRQKEYENIAVLCRDLEETERLGRKLKSKEYVKVIDTEDIVYSGGTLVIPSYFAKGLEFDAVILIQDKAREEESKLNYVMATRALHELVVFKV